MPVGGFAVAAHAGDDGSISSVGSAAADAAPAMTVRRDNSTTAFSPLQFLEYDTAGCLRFGLETTTKVTEPGRFRQQSARVSAAE
jgi:hypothetical protein